MTTSRRAFLRATGAVTGGIVLGAGPWRALQALADLGDVETGQASTFTRAPDNGGLGPLVTAGDDLELPPRFRYVRFGAAGELMANGRATPDRHDGMAAFSGDGGQILLVRNHEIGQGQPFGANPYDPACGGGTTTMVFDPEAGSLVATYASLTGTAVNCSGGRTPWGTWLSCEETTDGPGKHYSRRHGYCFEVDPRATFARPAEPLRAMGRFKREAACVDPATGIVYQTEDQKQSGLYRFVPNQPGVLDAGGRLQMLAIEGRPGYDLGHGHPGGTVLPVRWVDIPEPDPAKMDRDGRAVFNQGREQGAARWRRLEGTYFHNGRVVVITTNGGAAALGQVWEYDPGANELRLLFESVSSDVMRAPDNVTGAPWGGLTICEDGGGRDCLRGVTRDGQMFTIARNRSSGSEFAGPTFSPDGRWLFVNIQYPGATFAITGPWGKIP
jgi:secreted PhoX family phosphatase